MDSLEGHLGLEPLAYLFERESGFPETLDLLDQQEFLPPPMRPIMTCIAIGILGTKVPPPPDVPGGTLQHLPAIGADDLD